MVFPRNVNHCYFRIFLTLLEKEAMVDRVVNYSQLDLLLHFHGAKNDRIIAVCRDSNRV